MELHREGSAPEAWAAGLFFLETSFIKVLLSGGLSSLWGWITYFSRSCPRCIDAGKAGRVRHYISESVFHIRPLSFEWNTMETWGRQIIDAPGPNLLLWTIRKFKYTYWVYAHINRFREGPSHFQLYKSGEQWEGQGGSWNNCGRFNSHSKGCKFTNLRTWLLPS